MDKRLPSVVIALVTPSHFYFPKQFVINLLALTTYSYAIRGIESISFYCHSSPRTSANRNKATAYLLKSQASHLLFIDCDMTFPPDALIRLLNTAHTHPNSVISGIAPIGKHPFAPAIFYPWEEGEKQEHILDWKDEPFEIGAAGTFGMLIPREILEKLGDQAFDHIPNYFKPENVEEPGLENLELRHDLAFCLRARNAGYKVVCDPSVSFGHLRPYAATVEDFIRNRDGEKPRPLTDE